MHRPRRPSPTPLVALVLMAAPWLCGCAIHCGLPGTPARVVHLTRASIGRRFLVDGRVYQFMHMVDHTFFERLWALEEGNIVLRPQAKVEPLAAWPRRIDVRGILTYVPGGWGVEGGRISPHWALNVEEISRCWHPLHRATEYRLKLPAR